MALNNYLNTFKVKGGGTLLPKLDRYLIQKHAAEQESNERARGCIHPSELHKCVRAQVYHIIGAPENNESGAIDPKLARIFDNGHSVHARYQKYFTDMGITAKIIDGKTSTGVEVGLGIKELNVKGHADGILDMGELIVIEIKSINERGFRELLKAKPEHIRQTMLYMLKFKIKKGIVLYENKNTQETKEFLVIWDDKIIKELETRCATINYALINKQLPIREMCELPTDSAAKYCPYSRVCFTEKKFKELLKAEFWPEIERNILQLGQAEKPVAKRSIVFEVRRK